MHRTNVYVDAFNVYYGCTKGTPYRWLNLAKLSQMMLTNVQINQIKLFTGKVKSRPNDPNQPARQQLYFRALRTIPNLTIIPGSFVTHPKMMPKSQPLSSGKYEYVEVLYTQEKGSDVNLASHLLYDAFINDYDLAVVISNDSDLAEPIRIAKVKLKKKIGLINPSINRPEYKDAQGNIDYSLIECTPKLKKYANFCLVITEQILQQSQFLATLADSQGTFHKPASW